MNKQIPFSKFKTEIIDTGLCTHCGLCAGLVDGIEMIETPYGPMPHATKKNIQISNEVWQACPGKGLNYAQLNKFVFGNLPKSWLLGNYQSLAIGYATNPKIRRNGASGGVLTQVALHLLQSGKVNGVITLQMGKGKPWQAKPIIATTAVQIKKGSQSVYAPVPMLKILKELKDFKGKVAFIGLPDQVSAIRQLQKLKHPVAKKIKYLIGPYVGTNMYFESIRSFLRSKGVNDVEQIKELKYRDGEWPGYLSITLRDGRKFNLEKFYYNYLIPFFITKHSLLSVDFTNELTDISVGDAWNPKYEAQGEGFSVVIGRTEQGQTILNKLNKDKKLILDPITQKEALRMHAHMIEFKKRGAFIRFWIRSKLGLKNPDYGYYLKSFPLKRLLIEMIIQIMFWIGSWRLTHFVLELLPQKMVGRVFNFMRINWKKMTKTTKRQGLAGFEFEIGESNEKGNE